MFAAFVRFAVTVAAVPLCAEYLDGVKMLDPTNALVVGVILAAIYNVLRPVMRLTLSVLNFCTLGCLYRGGCVAGMDRRGAGGKQRGV